MNPKLLLILSFLLYASSFAQRVIPVKDPDNILITFGSCNAYYGDEPAEIFYRIMELKSDVWIWLGDVAYVDEKVFPPYFAYAGKEKVQETFNKIKARKEYSDFRKGTPMIGVWDDHDYGINNGNKYFPYKDVVQQLWLDFLDEPNDSPRRTRQGLYDSYYVGDETKVKVILLDVRYFKDKFGENDDMLGETQWKWFEEELKNNKAQYVLIGSGTQFLPDDRLIPEFWYAKSRERLTELIRKYKVNGVVMLSGDVHFAEILKHPCPERVGYNLYEFTSSGLTHHVSTHVPFADGFVRSIVPDTFSKTEQRYVERNFGVLKISFKENAGVLFEARNYTGHVSLQQFLPKNELTFNDSITKSTKECVLNESPVKRFFDKIKANLLHGEKFTYLYLGLIILVLSLLFLIIRGLFRILFWIIKLIIGSKAKSKTD